MVDAFRGRGAMQLESDPDKLFGGAVGELTQRGDLTDRVGPIQTVGDGFPDPFQKAALAYHWNAVAACSAQFVGRSPIVQ